MPWVLNSIMLRLSTTLCPFCEATALAKIFGPLWQVSRNASTMQKSKPSRMILSAKVGRSPPQTTTSGRGLVRKPRNSPFGGMNVTAVPLDVQRVRDRVSAAEQKRQTRMRPGKGAKDQKTKDPMKALKMQRALTNVSYERRNRVKQELLSRDSFDSFDLLPMIKESVSSQALGGLVDVSPTPIQRLAIPALLGTDSGRTSRRKRQGMESKGKLEQFLLAAETGSGKTLAYILPIVDAIKRAEAAEAEKAQSNIAEDLKKNSSRLFEVDHPDVDEPHPTTGRPRAIILVPTAELVSQVGSVLKSLAHTIKFRAAMLSASFSGTVIRNRLFTPVGIDIVVSTPHLLSSITESDPNILSRTSYLVIDEADSLLDRSFSPITSDIIDRATPSLSQLIFCSATIPRSLDSYLNKRYPDTKRLATPHLHAIPRRVQLSVIDIEKIPYQGNRNLACAQTIWDIGKEDAASSATQDASQEKKIVVFVNEREKTLELADYLRSKGIGATALSRDSGERKQAETLAAFTGLSPPPLSSPSRPGSAAARRLQSTHVLVTTDIASRGIDTLPVRHVILYDVPHTSIDFIHRLGRVGRMGRRGKGVVLVGKNDRRDVVREVREGMFKGQALI